MKYRLYEKIYQNIPDIKKIINLKNLEKGTCFIFGDGKSLKYYNLSSFSNYPSISLGLVSLLNGSKNLKLKYSLQCDSFSSFPGKNIFDYFQNFNSYIKAKKYSKAFDFISPYKLLRMSLNGYSKLYFKDNEILLNSNFITHCSNYYFTKFLNNSFYFNYHLKINENIDKDLSKNFFNVYESSLNFSIYLAIFLGFNKIYLVGCDYHDIEPMVAHWWEKGKPLTYTGKQAHNYIDFMRNYIDIHIITLNKSYGSNFISYKDFSGNNLEYKENREIINIKKLEMLKNQGIYRI